jgi:hypothetical protein
MERIGLVLLFLGGLLINDRDQYPKSVRGYVVSIEAGQANHGYGGAETWRFVRQYNFDGVADMWINVQVPGDSLNNYLAIPLTFPDGAMLVRIVAEVYQDDACRGNMSMAVYRTTLDGSRALIGTTDLDVFGRRALVLSMAENIDRSTYRYTAEFRGGRDPDVICDSAVIGIRGIIQ